MCVAYVCCQGSRHSLVLCRRDSGVPSFDFLILPRKRLNTMKFSLVALCAIPSATAFLGQVSHRNGVQLGIMNDFMSQLESSSTQLGASPESQVRQCTGSQRIMPSQAHPPFFSASWKLCHWRRRRYRPKGTRSSVG